MKKGFDREYRTDSMKEVEFLRNVGIPFTYVKVENGITVYKYKKTGELFRQLSVFYENE